MNDHGTVCFGPRAGPLLPWYDDGVKTVAAHLLDRLGIPYDVREYAYAEDELDAVTAAAKVGLPPEQVFKTLVARGDRTGIVMACIPASADLDLKALAACSGNKRADMIPVKDLPALTGYQRGGVSPLGGKRQIAVFVDERARGLDTVSVSAGRRGVQLVLSGPDLIRAAGATVAPLTRPKPSPR
jgi:Cys-tRNA(Pro)/Cys-tRNA(Cys) deacylase